MNNTEDYYISELTQIRKIVADNDELKLVLLREHADDLGLSSVSEYCYILGVNKRTIQNKLKYDKINYLKISDKKFPLINYK